LDNETQKRQTNLSRLMRDVNGICTQARLLGFLALSLLSAALGQLLGHNIG